MAAEGEAADARDLGIVGAAQLGKARGAGRIRGEVFHLVGIGGEIEELVGGREAVAAEIPVDVFPAGRDDGERLGGGRAPEIEERQVIAHAAGGIGEQRREVAAVEVGGRGHAGEGEDRRGHVHVGRDRVADGAGVSAREARVVDEERRLRGLLVGQDLVAEAVRAGAVAVVRGEEDDGVVGEALARERLADHADGGIDAGDERIVERGGAVVVR